MNWVEAGVSVYHWGFVTRVLESPSASMAIVVGCPSSVIAPTVSSMDPQVVGMESATVDHSGASGAIYFARASSARR